MKLDILRAFTFDFKGAVRLVRRSVGGISPRGSGFDSSWWAKWHWDRFISQYSVPPPSLRFRQCSIHIFISFLPAGQIVQVWENSIMQCSFANRLTFERKFISQICVLVLAYLLTPRCRVLLQQLTGSQLAKKFPAFHGTRRFITAITSARQLSLS